LCFWSHILLKASCFWIFSSVYFLSWYIASKIFDGIDLFFSFAIDKNWSVLRCLPYVSRTEYQATGALSTISILLVTFLSTKLFIYGDSASLKCSLPWSFPSLVLNPFEWISPFFCVVLLRKMPGDAPEVFYRVYKTT
jgi:hypothetical protein